MLAAAVAGATLAAGACTVGPNYRAPELRLEASFGPAAPPAQAGAWWRQLQDPALDALISAAVENNLDLRLATARIREARAQRAIVRGTAEPEINGSAGYSHNRFSQNAAPFNAFDVPGFPWEYNLYQAGFDASWEIDLFGGARRAVEAANASVQAGEEDRRSALVTLLGEVARNYIDLRGAQDRRRIALQNLEAQRQTVELTRERMTQGLGTQLDVTRAEAQVAQTAAQVPLYEREEWQALHRLSLLTNRPLDGLFVLREPAPVPIAPDSVLVGVPADLLRRRPDIRRAERQLAAATARIGVAEAELYPKLSLTGFFNFQSASIEDIFDWRSRAFGIGPTVTWPIFQAGRLRAAVAVRNAQQEEALVTYEQTVQRAVEEVRDELVTFQTERQRQASLQDAVRAQQESFDLATQLYRQGLTDFLSVLDAQRQLFEAQDALARSRAQATAAVVALYKALGGGWDADFRQPPNATRPAPTSPDSPSVPATTLPATAPSPEPPHEYFTQ
jgi:NodT family efflux transporter outer membrane factor (OMF) lipoprotein